MKLRELPARQEPWYEVCVVGLASQPAAEARGDDSHISVSRPRLEPETLNSRQKAIRQRIWCCVPSFVCFERGLCGSCSRGGG